MNLREILEEISTLELKILDETGFLTRDDKESLLVKTAEIRTALGRIMSERRLV